MLTTQNDLPEIVETHLRDFSLRLDVLEKKIESGFPLGDPIEHRKVHEQYIKDAAERASLWKSLREKTITGIIWAGLILLSTSLWEYLKTLVKQ